MKRALTIAVLLTAFFYGQAYADKIKIYGEEVTKSTEQTITGKKTFTGDTTHNDNVKAKFGTDGDASVYFDGSSLKIDGPGAGSIEIDSAGNVLINESSNSRVLKVGTAGNGIIRAGNEFQLVNTASDGFFTSSRGIKIRPSSGQSVRFLQSNNTEHMTFEGDTGNLGLGTTSWGTSATSVFAISGSVAPTTSPADTAQLWAEDIAGAGTTGFKMRDENGNTYEFGNGMAISADADTIADSGDANPATATLDPTSSHVQITCNDTDSCDITMGETNARDGQLVRIICMTTNTCDFSDTAGVSELAGAASLGQYDTLSLIYASDRWVELARSNN